MASIVTLTNMRCLRPRDGRDGWSIKSNQQISSVQGQVTVNGNLAQTGLTVLSNSLIATGTNGRAFIDLGSLGRIDLRASATARLVFTKSSINLISQCPHSKIRVTRGVVSVTSPKQESIVQGNAKSYDGPTELHTAGATDFVVDCGGPDLAAPVLLGGGTTGGIIWGIIGLSGAIGVGAVSPIR